MTFVNVILVFKCFRILFISGIYNDLAIYTGKKHNSTLIYDPRSLFKIHARDWLPGNNECIIHSKCLQILSFPFSLSLQLSF